MLENFLELELLHLTEHPHVIKVITIIAVKFILHFTYKLFGKNIL